MHAQERQHSSCAKRAIFDRGSEQVHCKAHKDLFYRDLAIGKRLLFTLPLRGLS